MPYVRWPLWYDLSKGRDRWRTLLLVLYSCYAAFVTVAICYHRLIVYSNNDAVRLLCVVMRSLSERRDMGHCCCRLWCTQIRISSSSSLLRALALLLAVCSSDAVITVTICYHRLTVFSSTDAVRPLWWDLSLKDEINYGTRWGLILYSGTDTVYFVSLRALALLLVLNSCDAVITVAICYHRLTVYSKTHAVRPLSVVIRSLFKGRDMRRALLLVLNSCEAVIIVAINLLSLAHSLL